jgi:glycogen operon protein
MDSLRYWVTEMHVDGFRFDLASALARSFHDVDMLGSFMSTIQQDPVLRTVKLIAEPWDLGEGGYQVGNFPSLWTEWNGRFRDDVRAFLRGDAGVAGRFADRLLASPDLYLADNRDPEQSINFVTCHDGFTLNDLVSYDRKHNEANGEENRDGGDDNRSWNCGAEGPTDDAAVEALRARQVRNFLAVTLLSKGVPMLGMGDEVRRSQGGNNNAYCQDNEVSWLDWGLVDRHPDLLRFVRLLVRLRSTFNPTLPARGLTLTDFLAHSRVEWHGVRLGAPDWSGSSRSVAVGISALDGSYRIHCVFNAWSGPLDFELPPAPGGWRRLVDTSRAPPGDACPWAEAPVEGGRTCRVESRSVVVLGTISAPRVGAAGA